MSTNICFLRDSFTEISNNKYIFNNNHSINISYGLYKTETESEEESIYKINNIPKEHPLGFYIDGSDNSGLENLITYRSDKNNSDSIIIYVSKGNDISYNNGDYFRFFDASYNIINISRNIINYESQLEENRNDVFVVLNSINNFYFMRNVSYKFIATLDFSSSFPFELSGNFENPNLPLQLTTIDSSFTFMIPNNADNSNNKLTYYDLNNKNVFDDLEILVDNSNINYYYDNIELRVDASYLDFSYILLSIKSYNSDICNINLFKYDNQCNYIIAGNEQLQDILSSNNKECLTQISQSQSKSKLNNTKYYEFNVETHNDLIKQKVNFENIKYGLYDGSYIIFNINKSYPITLDNIDISNSIYIDDNYYYTKKYDKNSEIINKLTGSDIKFNKYDYYYGAIKIIIDNSSNTFVDNSDISYLILDISENTIYDFSNVFFYTSFCFTNTDNFLTTINQNIIFKLYNQKNIEFNEIDNNNPENIYNLNLFENYKKIKSNEIIREFRAEDIYGHDLTSLIDISMITSSANQYTEDISNILNVTNNYQLNSFLIIYNLKYFDLQDIQRNRIININYGPYIEISNNEDIFVNKNSDTNKIDISTNINIITESSFNFYKNIEVYVIDISNRNKIYLPFEVILNGFYYDVNSNIYNKENNKINLNNISVIEYQNNVNINNLNHYISNNLKLEIARNNLNSNEINLNTTLVSDEPFKLENINIETLNYNSDNSDFSNNIKNIFYEIKNNNLIIKGSEVKITDIIKSIDNNNDNSYTINLIQNSSISPINIKTVITISNETQNYPERLFVEFENIDNSKNFLSINCEFYRNIFFDNNFIDISFIGDYSLDINILGLQENDFILNNNNFISQIQINSNNLTKKYNIEILDKQNPVLNFNIISVDTDTLYDYSYNYPKIKNFNILQDIIFIDNSESNSVKINSRKPIIFYNDNSIYTPTLSYEIIDTTITNISYDIVNDIIGISGSSSSNCTIKYFIIDLCNNRSNYISLNLTFLDIPFLKLNGELNIETEVNFHYTDNGLLINDILADLSYTYENIRNSETFETKIVLIDGINYFVEISNSLILKDRLGEYELRYTVNEGSEKDSENNDFIIRNINVSKKNKPYLYLFDFSNSSNNFNQLVDISKGIFPMDLSNMLFTSVYLPDTSYTELSNNNINYFGKDFNITYESNFEDLSKILNAYDLCDNFFIDASINQKIIINLSNENIIFKDTSSNTYLNILELSYNNISYLSQDGSLNVVTKSIYFPNPKLDISYIFTDLCNNIFEFKRSIDIIDNTPPTINFNELEELSNNSFILYNSSNHKDFSYQAFNYDVDPSNFLNEINNILFGFELSDNYSTPDSIKNNYNITISGSGFDNIHNINTLNDICSNLTSFKNIFKKINSSIEIIYDFSDNQYNNSKTTRNINIINTLEPSLNVIANTYNNQYTGFINISFGDLNYNFLNDICLSHIRLNSNDISFELSYNLPLERITSISYNNINYDPSALIYQYNNNINYILIDDISFLNIATNPSPNNEVIYSKILNPNVFITIDPPKFYPENLESLIIRHEAGTYLSDASLIDDIYVYSKFDEFYFNNNPDICYSETIFTTIIDKSFNSIKPIHDNYTIYYSASDRNDISSSVNRTLIVEDTQPPIITFIGASNEDIQFTNENYIDTNINIEDVGSNLKKLEIFITKETTNNNTVIDNSLQIINLTSRNSQIYNYSNNQLLFIDQNNANITYKINYIAYDIHDNSSQKIRIINILSRETIILNPKMIINSSNNIIEKNLISDFSINTLDLSLNFINSIKTIFYEATNKETFLNNISFDFDPLFNNQNSNIIKINSINNIESNVVGNYNIFFQAFITNNEEIVTNNEIINFEVIDTTGPILRFLNNNNDITLPLLDNSILNVLNNDINFFNKHYIDVCNNIQFVKIDNDIIFSLPGVNITDITYDFSVNSLSNETLEVNNIFKMNVKYTKNSIDYDPSYILTNSGEYIQNYKVTDQYGNSSDISRNLLINIFKPFIKFNYNSNIKTHDSCGNIYTKEYHKLFDDYELLEAFKFDYYTPDSITDSSLIIIYPDINNRSILNINIENTYNLNYIIENKETNLSNNKIHPVEVVNMDQFYNNINLNDIINNSSSLKYGVYGKNIELTIKVDTSANAIRLEDNRINENIIVNDNNFNMDNMIELSSNSIFNKLGNKYYYNNVTIKIKNNFNRASLIYLKDNSDVILKDFLLYNINFETTDIQIPDTLYNFNEINVKVKNDIDINHHQKKNSKYELQHNNEGYVETKNLYLSFGVYKFYQNHVSNFKNPIKFSYLPDGHHYNYSDIKERFKKDISLSNIQNIKDISFTGKDDINFNKYSYTKNVNRVGLPGFNNKFKNKKLQNKSDRSYVEIIIDATTPSPLYYYSDNFKDMGGKIEIKNNITLFQKNNSLNIILNGNILANNINSNNIYDKVDNSDNKIVLSSKCKLTKSSTNEEISGVNFIGITQKNINHNMIFNNENKKIIFKKYEDVSDHTNIDNYNFRNYSIKQDNSFNYLYDNSNSDVIHPNILSFNYIIDNSINLLNNRNNFFIDLNKIYFSNQELIKYRSFFKNNKLLDKNINYINETFKNKINEITYNNKVNIFSGDENYQYFSNNYLNTNKISIEPLFDNLITLNLQTYIDISYLEKEIDINSLEFLKEQYFNNISDIRITNNDTDNNNLFFQEFIVTIYSDICGSFSTQVSSRFDGMIFENGDLEIRDHLLDSSNSSNFINNIMPGDDSDLIKDRIFFVIGETSQNINKFNGLTQQNIYHNMFIDEENKFIFHKYDTSSVNLTVNDINTLLIETRENNINSNTYLIELSNNDPYNCFIDSEDIYDNVYLKNNNFRQNFSDVNEGYRTKICYNTIDQLDTYNNFIEDLGIVPQRVNNIDSSGELNTHSYIINLQNYIDRNFYNTTRYQTDKNKPPYDTINYSKIYYILKDICYNSIHEFSIYDLSIKQNIIYKKQEINILKELQGLILITNLKIIYLVDDIIKRVLYNGSTIDYNNLNRDLIYSNDFENLVSLFKETNFINNNYNLEVLETTSLNDLFARAVFNTKTLINNSNLLNQGTEFYTNIIPIKNNRYNDVSTFEKISQIMKDVNIVSDSIQNIINNYYFRYSKSIIIHEFFKTNEKTIQNQINSFDLFSINIKKLSEIREKYNKLNLELDLRHDNLDFDRGNPYVEKEIYNSLDISNCFHILRDNYLKLIYDLRYDISNSDFDLKFITGKKWNIESTLSFSPKENDIDISSIYNNFQYNFDSLYTILNNPHNHNNNFITISNDYWNDNCAINFSNVLKEIFTDNNNILTDGTLQKLYVKLSDSSYAIAVVSDNEHYIEELSLININIQNNYDDISNIQILNDKIITKLDYTMVQYIDNINTKYDYIKKLINFSNINYILDGNEILINSFKSNNILMKFDLYYNSYLYPNRYLDTVVLDIAIPDYNPPSIVFNNSEIITLNQRMSNENDIGNLLDLLLNDISYIDINQFDNPKYDDDLNRRNIIYNYYDNIRDISYVDVSNSDYTSVIEIDVTPLYNNIYLENGVSYANIIYKLTDYANNTGIYERKVKVLTFFTSAKIYLNNINNEIETEYFDTNLIISPDDSVANIISRAKNNIIIKDFESESSFKFYTKEDPLFDVLVNISIEYDSNNTPIEVIYTLSTSYGVNNIVQKKRIIVIDSVEEEIIDKTHCCYPKVFYKPVQHNYKLGSFGSSRIRLAKIIINS